MEEKKRNLSLKGYYQSLPDRTAPKTKFLDTLVRRCGVTLQTARNWVLYGIKPSSKEHIKVITELTGIEEEYLWQQD